MSEIKDKILDTLHSKGSSITDSDVLTVNRLLSDLEDSGDLDFDDFEDFKTYIDRLISQYSIEPDSKLSQDGGS